MVNEMLTQMESFQGMLFATTNLMQGMDAAAMRRFDMKINLRPPRGDQLHALLTHVSAQLGIDVLPIERCSRLSSLGITPGDVAAVTRRCEFSPVTTSEQLNQALEAEANFKPNRETTSIGFL
jgi:SpoVK/Ycf46/Vps4 family AAA+-type ATPase